MPSYATVEIKKSERRRRGAAVSKPVPGRQSSESGSDAHDFAVPASGYAALTGYLASLGASIQRETVARLMSTLSAEQRAWPQQYTAAVRLIADLSAIYSDATRSLPRRCVGMAKILSAYEGPLPDNLRALQQGLTLVSGIERLVDAATGGYDAVDIDGVVAAIRDIVRHDAVRAVLPETRGEQFLSVLQASVQAFDCLAQLNRVDSDAGFDRYLTLFVSWQQKNDRMPGMLTSLAGLVEDIRSRIARLPAGLTRHCGAFPVDGGIAAQLGWLMRLVEIDEVRAELASWLDPQSMALLATPHALVELLGDFPGDASAWEQLRWIASLDSAPATRKMIEGTALRPVLESIGAALGGNGRIALAFDFLTRFTASDIGRLEQARMLATTLLGPARLRNMAALLTPFSPLAPFVPLAPFSPLAQLGLGMYDTYTQWPTLPPGMTWRETARFFVGEVARFVEDKPALIGSLIGVDSGYVRTVAELVRRLPSIHAEWTWEQAANWLVEEAVKNTPARWYFDRFLEVCLVWRFYQIIGWRDAVEDPQALQQIVKLVRRYLPGSGELVIDALQTAWPLLPGLIALREERGALPATDSWIGWLNSVVESATHSEHPAVQGLVVQIDALACSVGTEAICNVFDSLRGVPGNPAASSSARAPARSPADTSAGGQAQAASAGAAPLSYSHAGSVVALARHVVQPLTSLRDVCTGYGHALAARAFMKMPANSDELGLVFACLAVLNAADGSANSQDVMTLMSAGSLSSDEHGVVGLSSPRTQPRTTIWGDEQIARERQLATASLAAYWLATAWVAYKVMKPVHASDRRHATAPTARASRLLNCLTRYRGELALGATVMLGAGMTAYCVKKYYRDDGLEAAIARLLDNIVCADVTAIPAFHEVFSSGTGRTLKSTAPIEGSADTQEKIRAYLATLGGELESHAPLKRFYDHLTARLLPKLAAIEGVTSRLNDDFALLAELDLMILRMQRYIVSMIVAFDNFTDFNALLLLNQVRNFVIRILLQKYRDRTLNYYLALTEQKEFAELDEFWKEKMPASYLRYLLHGEGLSDPDIEYYHNVLKTILGAAMLSGSVATRHGTVGFIGEAGVIKLMVEGVDRTLRYYDGKLTWDEAGAASDENNEKQADKDLAKKLVDIAGYLEKASRALVKNGPQAFMYPGGARAYEVSVFIKRRVREIVGAGHQANPIIPVTYTCENEKRVVLFNIEQVIMGVHKKHLNYEKDNAEIGWPAAWPDETKKRLCDIEAELTRAKKIKADIELLRTYKATLKAAKIDGVVQYVDNAIRVAAQQRGIANGATFDTRVVVSTTDIKAAPISSIAPSRQIFTVKKEYSLGEIALRKLKSTRDMQVSPRGLTQLVEHLNGQDFQTAYQAEVTRLMASMEIKKAFDAVMLSKVKHLLAQPGRLHWMTYSGYELAGLLMYKKENNRVDVLSLVDDTLKEFGSPADIEDVFRRDKHVARWMLTHSVDPLAAWKYDKFGGYPAGSIIPISFDEDDKLSSRLSYRQVDPASFSFYQDFLKRLYRQTDLLALSESEMVWQVVLDWLELFAIAVSFFSMPLGPLAGFVIGVATSSGPAIGRAIIEDDPDEQSRYLLQAAIGLMSEVALARAPYVLMSTVKLVGSSRAYRRLLGWMTTGNAGDPFYALRHAARSAPSLEWTRNLDYELPVLKDGKIERWMARADSALRDAGFQRKGSLETAAALDAIASSGRGLPGFGNRHVPIRFRSINQWDRLHPASRTGHLVTVVEWDHVKYVIDPSPMSAVAAQPDGKLLMLEQEWFRRHQAAMKSRLCKYKDFTSLDAAKKYNDAQFSFDVGKTESGTVVLSSPDWYEPDLLNYAGLDAQWQVNIDLSGLTPDAEGIYRMHRTTSSASTPVDYYIRNHDSAVYRVKWDDGAHTWRMIDPDNASGYAPPVRRNANGAWVRHLDLAGKGGAPARVVQTLLTGKPLDRLKQFTQNGRRRALEQLDVARAVVKSGEHADMVATVAESLWGYKWRDEFARPYLVDKLGGDLDLLRQRVSRFDPASDVNYYNTAVFQAGGTTGGSSMIVAELDQMRYAAVVQGKAAGAYVNAYETGANFIRSRDDLGQTYMGRIIVHEMTHAGGKAGELSTVDLAYIGILRPDKKHNLTALAKLAADPAEAANNADSYATFVQYVAHFRRHPHKYVEFKEAFANWKIVQKHDPGAEFLFDFHVPAAPGVGAVIQRNVQDIALNVVWRRADDHAKIAWLIQHAARLPEASELAFLVGDEVVKRALGNSLWFDFDGIRKTRFSWGTTYDVDLEKLRVRLRNDLRRYKEAQAHLTVLQQNPPTLNQPTVPGTSVEDAAAGWILGTDGAGGVEAAALGEMVGTLRKYRSADLFDRAVVDAIHNDLYRSAGGITRRTFRTADDPVSMSLDVADAVFTRRLTSAATELRGNGETLFAAAVRGRPYGEGNVRTARMLYALHGLRANPVTFRGLSAADESVLRGTVVVAGRETAPLAASSAALPVRVAVDAVGTLRSAALREYRILDLGSAVDVGTARVGNQATHITAWRAGERPLDRPRDDLVVNAGLLNLPARRAPVAGRSDAGALLLLFYRPAAYRILDRDLDLLMRRVDRFDTEGGSTASVAGYRANEFRTVQHGAWTDAAWAPDDPIFDCGGALGDPGGDMPAGEALGKLGDYTSTHYEYDDLKIRTMSLLGGASGSDLQAADILSFDDAASSGAGSRMSLGDLRRQAAGIGPAYKRLHICVCRPLGEAAASTIELSTRDPSLAQRLRAGADPAAPTDTSDLATQSALRVPISHLVTLITVDNLQGTVEETVQGVVTKSTRDYVDIDPAAGDRLSLPDYETQEWSAATPWALSDDALNAAN